MNPQPPNAEPLLTPAEVAAMFRVDPKTDTRWAKAGKLTSIRTLGGHRRYREAEVRGILNQSAQTGPGQPARPPGRRADGDNYAGTGHRAVAPAGDRRPGR